MTKLWEFVIEFFRTPNELDGYKWAIEQLKSGAVDREDLETYSDSSGLGQTAFDRGIRNALRDFRAPNDLEMKS